MKVILAIQHYSERHNSVPKLYVRCIVTLAEYRFRPIVSSYVDGPKFDRSELSCHALISIRNLGENSTV